MMKNTCENSQEKTTVNERTKRFLDSMELRQKLMLEQLANEPNSWKQARKDHDIRFIKQRKETPKIEVNSSLKLS